MKSDISRKQSLQMQNPCYHACNYLARVNVLRQQQYPGTRNYLTFVQTHSSMIVCNRMDEFVTELS